MLKKIISYTVWPFLVFGGIFCNYFFIAQGYSREYTSLISIAIFALCVLVLEWVIPYSEEWHSKPDQFLLNDVLYYVINYVIASMVIPLATILCLKFLSFFSYEGLWPTHWTYLSQIILALIVADFGSYWSHRIFHKNAVFWRFHAIHHSLERLSLTNAYTNHPFDNLRDLLPLLLPIIILGAPHDIILWHATISGFVTILLHSNIDTRCGIFNYIFNTPELHRWHHSFVIKESNTNYSFNLVFWDVVFGTFYLPRRSFTKEVGISDKIPHNIRYLMMDMKFSFFK